MKNTKTSMSANRKRTQARAEERRLEGVARDVWESRSAKGRSWQDEIDRIVDPLMKTVPLLSEPTGARGITSRPR